MSQHHFEADCDGQKVRVTLGWDSPLQYVFMNIEKLDAPDVEDDDDDDGYLYSSLYETLEPQELTLDHFRLVLASLRLVVPETMFEQVAHDQRHNVGNRFCTHTAAGFS